MVPTTLRTISGNYYMINFLKVLLTEWANEYDNSKHFNILGPKMTATGAINEFYIRYNILFSKDDSQKVAFIVCLYGRV